MSSFDHSKTPKLNTQSHDTEAPPNLIQFMLSKWKPASKKLPKVIKCAGNFAGRRKALSKHFPGECLVIPTGHSRVRSNDTFFTFRPGTDFFYLTGNQEPDCVLVLIPEGESHRELLFVEPNPGKTDATFFTDRVKGELWEGPRLGVPESRALFGIQECYGLPELEPKLKAAVLQAPKGYRVLRGYSPRVEEWLDKKDDSQKARDKELHVILDEMKLLKDKDEVRELQIAIDSTQRGFEDVIHRLKTAKNERELEGVFYTRARMEGNDVGYHSIVGSGSHGCTLHWKKNDGELRKGDLLLLDAGVEGRSLYTADITRTLPMKGKFSKEQREIYDLVHAAQAAAFQAVKPGNDFMEPNRHAMKVLAEGLEKLGILPMSAEEALQKENQFYRRYSLHNVSHMLGLDVHDCAKARAENYKYGKLVAGMVLTIEPGLYFQLDDLTVPQKYRGIGIRIEDDVLVTEKGFRNLSEKIPSKANDVERWMAKVWKRR